MRPSHPPGTPGRFSKHLIAVAAEPIHFVRRGGSLFNRFASRYQAFASWVTETVASRFMYTVLITTGSSFSSSTTTA